MSQNSIKTRLEAEELVRSRPWWYHKFEIYPEVWTPGVYDPSGTLSKLDLPSDMSGMRVIEIGPSDGYFTKALSDRGADVHAYDYAARDFYGFAVMEQLAGRAFNHRQINIYDLPTKSLPSFDLILCLGVLYHLPDPVRALCILSQIRAPRLILETFVSEKYADQPVAEYLPGTTANNDYTNFWAPNIRCCELMLQDAGFQVTKTWPNASRAMFHCSRNPDAPLTKKLRVAYTQLEP